jgi:hypothetical protein
MRVTLVSVVGAGGLLIAAACSAPYGEDEPSVAAASTGRDAGTTTTNPTDPLPPAKKLPPASGADGGGVGGGGGGGGADAAAANPDQCPKKGTPTVGTWKAPPAASSVCSGADMTYFAQVAANQTWLGVESLMRTRNAGCAKCIFSKETDAQWRPVVYVGTEGDAIVNYGACFNRTAGGTEACGRSVHLWSDCYADVCDYDTCGTEAATNTCYDGQAVADSCSSYSAITACGGDTKYASLNNICGTYIEVARVLCAAGN